MRGSDDSAAIYWLSRMLEGGEDPKFVARRLIIFASEDIGRTLLHSVYICEVYDVYHKLSPIQKNYIA